MAYNIPTLHRLPYHLDGTIGVFSVVSTGSSALLSNANLQSLNNESSDTPWSGNGCPDGSYRPGAGRTALLFPVLMDISAVQVRNGSNMGTVTFEWSANTTDGINGTWTTFTVSDRSTATDISTSVRSPSALSGGTLTGVRSIRMNSSWNDGNSYITTFAVWGTPTTSGEFLQLWDPSSDVRLAPEDLDFGAVAVAGTSTIQFRVKNVGSTYTTSDVTLSAVALTDTTIASGVTFSPDNSTFTSTLNIGSLAPGAISSVVYAKLTMPSIGAGPRQIVIKAVGT